jgi:adenylate kinase family enzyme
MNKIYFLIGASGAGKTTALKELEKRNPPGFRFFYFDSIGVPSFEDMDKEYGSGEEWQRVKTIEWAKSLKNETGEGKMVLDGQTRPAFIEEGCKEAGITDYSIILFDCSDDVRRERLIGRGHPELASDAMMHWAGYLRENCKAEKCTIIDNSSLSPMDTVSVLAKELGF